MQAEAGSVPQRGAAVRPRSAAAAAALALALAALAASTESAHAQIAAPAATVDAARLVLVYDVALEADSVPPAGAYAVRVDDHATLTPTAVAVTASSTLSTLSTVALTLPQPVAPGRTVTLTYAVPASNPVQSTGGALAAALTDWPVVNARDDVSTVYLDTRRHMGGTSTFEGTPSSQYTYEGFAQPFTTGPRALGYNMVTAFRLVRGSSGNLNLAYSELTASSTLPYVGGIAATVAKRTGQGLVEFTPEWILPDTTYAATIESDATMTYLYSGGDEGAGVAAEAADGWSIASSLFTLSTLTGGGWYERDADILDGGTVVLLMHGVTEPAFVGDVIVDARGGRRGFVRIGGLVEPGNNVDSGRFSYGDPASSSVVEEFSAAAAGVTFELTWDRGFDAAMPIDVVLEFAGAQFALDDATRVGDHSMDQHIRTYRWEQAWLDVNAPWLAASAYQTTLPLDRRVGLCFRTLEATCPTATTTATTTLSALTLREANRNAVGLEPRFRDVEPSYAAQVAVAVGTVTVAATSTAGHGAVFFFDGDGAALPDADPDAAGHQVALKAGENTIRVRVNVHGATRTYTVAVTRTAPAATLGDKSELVPSGLALGDGFRLLFLTSTARALGATDIVDYDEFVQQRAAAGHADIASLEGLFKALGCTADVDARDHTGTTYAGTYLGEPIYWLNGARVANNYRDFYDGSWDDEVDDRNESGTDGPDTSAPANYPATGCQADGTEDVSFALGSTSLVRLGRPNSDSGSPLTGAATGPTDARPLYGLSGVMTARDAAPRPSSGHLVLQSGEKVFVYFDEDLEGDAAYRAPPGAFTVTADGTDIAVDFVSVGIPGSADANRLSLDVVRTVLQGQTVTVAYRDPTPGDDASALQDEAGNDTASFSGLAVANTSTATATPPGVPRGLAATADGRTRIDLAWTAPTSDGGSPVVGYWIEVSEDGGTTWADLVADTGGTGTTHTHTGLRAGSTRRYRVSAINAAGPGDASSAAEATTDPDVPEAPRNLSASADGGTAIDLAWDAPAHDGGRAVVGYRIERSPNAGGGWTVLAANTGSAARTYEDGGLLPYTRWHYRVSAINAEGAGPASGSVSARTAASAPEAPRNLSATLVGQTRVDLSWTPPARINAASLSGYRIEASEDGGAFAALVADTGTTATAYMHTGLAIGGNWRYRVYAINATGTGPASNVAVANTGLPVKVGFEVTLYNAVEGGRPARVRLVLSGPRGAPLTIPLTVAHLGASADDYSMPTSVSFGAQQTSATFTVTAEDDVDPEGSEALRLGFDTLPAGVTAGLYERATVSLVDDDGGPIELRMPAGTLSAREGGGGARVTMDLSRKARTDLSIPLAVEHLGGATAADYTGVPSSVTFAEGRQEAEFTVRAVDDDDNDDNESLRISAGTLPSGVALSRQWPGPVTVELVDDDGVSEWLVSFGAESYTATEGGADAAVTVEVDAAVEIEPLEVRLAWEYLGGATAADHSPSPIPMFVTIPLGARQQTLTLTAVDDAVDDDGESVRLGFFVSVSSRTPPVRWRLGDGPLRTLVSLADDDGATGMADAQVSDALLTLRYAAPLDGFWLPSGSDFVVLAGPPDAARELPVTAVAAAGAELRLTLALPALPDEPVRLSYLAGALHPLQDAAGERVRPLADLAVRNETRPPPDAPLLPALASPGDASAPDPQATAPTPTADPAPWPQPTESGRLDLSSRNLADLRALSALPGLTQVRELKLAGNALADAAVLATLADLRILDLSDNALADAWPLAELTALERLDLSGNRIADLSPLAGLAALERLDLSGNRIADISPLAGLAALEVLLLDGNRIADTLPLSQLPALVRLGLADNRIADIALLAELSTLARLNLADNALTDISPLGDLSRLISLNLAGNPLADTSPLGRLTLLQWLWLDPAHPAVPMGAHRPARIPAP